MDLPRPMSDLRMRETSPPDMLKRSASPASSPGPPGGLSEEEECETTTFKFRKAKGRKKINTAFDLRAANRAKGKLSVLGRINVPGMSQMFAGVRRPGKDVPLVPVRRKMFKKARKDSGKPIAEATETALVK